jgi:hypothetical protein
MMALTFVFLMAVRVERVQRADRCRQRTAQCKVHYRQRAPPKVQQINRLEFCRARQAYLCEKSVVDFSKNRSYTG